MVKNEMFGPFEIFGPFKTILNLGIDRERSIKENISAVFEIEERRLSRNEGKRNIFENLKDAADQMISDVSTIDYLGKRAVKKFNKEILQHSEKNNIDPDLTRAIVYAENAKGWYGLPFDASHTSKTVLPMNIHKSKWADLVAKQREDIYDSNTNIETGALLLKRIRDRVNTPTPEKIGTLWNNLQAENISEFGNYVGSTYKKKPWKNLD